MNNNSLKFIGKEKLYLKGASAIAIRNNSELFIGCCLKNGIHVFDMDFNKLYCFPEVKVDEISYITFNKDESELFLSSCTEEKIVRFDLATRKILREYEFDRPWKMITYNNKLIFCSGESLHVFDTEKDETITIITTEGFTQCENFSGMGGLYMDSMNKMYLCIKEKNSEYSNSRSLLVLDNDFNKILHTYPVGMMEFVHDMIVVNNNAFFLANEDQVYNFMNRIIFNN